MNGIICSVLLVLLPVVIQGQDDLRKTGVKLELMVLKKLYEDALLHMNDIIRIADDACPDCVDKCADSCLHRQLDAFKEKLERQLEVLCELIHWAAKECPGEYWTRTPAVGGTAPLIAVPLVVDLSRETPIMRNRDEERPVRVLTENLIVASAGAVVGENGILSEMLSGDIQSIALDHVFNRLYVGRDVDGISKVELISSEFSRTSAIEEFTDGFRVVDIMVAGYGTIYVLTTDGTDTRLVKVSYISSRGKGGTILATIEGVVGRRLTIHQSGRTAYFSAFSGIYKVNLRTPEAASLVFPLYNARGIALDTTRMELIICNDNNGILQYVNLLNGMSFTNATDGAGCSDLEIYQKNEELKIFVAYPSMNFINEYNRLETIGTNRMSGTFVPGSQVSVVVWPTSGLDPLGAA